MAQKSWQSMVWEEVGTKVFALAGKVAKGGLIEAPMGITLRSYYDIGGGIMIKSLRQSVGRTFWRMYSQVSHRHF